MKPGLKNPLMRVTNLLLYLSFCGLIGTGALMQWKLIPGSQGGHGLTVLDMNRHEWGDIHLWLGVVCVGATLFHLILNWPWLKKIASSGKAWRLVAGLTAGLVIIFGTYTLPLQQRADNLESPGQENHQQGQQLRKGW
ncbi:MAG TPA: DUF4405 domain-containing protein [Opitutales bacterium]|nr:DUF4405 domain-containing protein [Opitutales bacterium]